MNVMKKSIAAFFFGLVVGVVAIVLWTGTAATDLMILEDVSDLDFDATVIAITDGAADAGWKVPAVHPISESVVAAGFDVERLTVIELCKAELAGEILTEGGDMRVAAMMPCRVAVYENDDGDVVVSRMNSTLMSKLFGSAVARTMAKAAEENEQIFESVLGAH